MGVGVAGGAGRGRRVGGERGGGRGGSGQRGAAEVGSSGRAADAVQLLGLRSGTGLIDSSLPGNC